MRPKKYTHGTGKRRIVIAPFRDKWVIIMENDNLGEYSTPQMALDDLVGGQTTFPPSGIDPSTLGLPEDIEDWKCSPL